MVESDLISYKSNEAACGVLLGSGAIVVGLRFCSRLKQRADLKWDYCLTIPVYVSQDSTSLERLQCRA